MDFQAIVTAHLNKNKGSLLERIIKNVSFSTIWSSMTEREKLKFSPHTIDQPLYIVRELTDGNTQQELSTPDEAAAMVYYLKIQSTLKPNQSLEFDVAKVAGGNHRDGWAYDPADLQIYLAREDAEDWFDPNILLEEKEIQAGAAPSDLENS